MENAYIFSSRIGKIFDRENRENREMESKKLVFMRVSAVPGFLKFAGILWERIAIMSELEEKVKMSIERLKAFEPKNGEGYYLAFSGGKDSVVIKALADMAGVKYDAHYRVTSVDPPELVQFIKRKYPDVARDVPRYPDGKPITMWNLIPKKLMPPTQIQRFCCAELKEGGGDGRKTITGVRWAESVNRKKNQGLVTITKKSIAKELRDNPNFQQTVRGGWCW